MWDVNAEKRKSWEEVNQFDLNYVGCEHEEDLLEILAICHV